MFKYHDPNNAASVEADLSTWRPSGAQPFKLDAKPFDPSQIDQAETSLWRYRHAMNIDLDDQAWRSTTLGEGMSALVPAAQPGLSFKMEFVMPSASFKDRGVAVMMAQAKAWGCRRVVVDSSGNAASSVAAYAARTNMECDVFVPAATSDGKLQQIAAHGATIHKVPGTREDTATAAQDFLVFNDAFYASHVYNPLFHQGTMTMAFELWEQARDTSVLYVPVGNGTMLLGAIYGYQALIDSGVLAEMPKIIAVQSAACAPIQQAHVANAPDVAPVTNTGTVAEGIAIAAPARGFEILQALRAVDAAIVTVDDDEVAAAKNALALQGFYVEPTAAVCYAAYLSGTAQPVSGKTVVPLCGSGLKSSKPA